MTGIKTNERPGTRAVAQALRCSAYKAREVLDLVRGKDYQRASEILEYCDREVGRHRQGPPLRRVERFHNDGIDPEDCSCRLVTRTRARRSSAGGPVPAAARRVFESGPATSRSSCSRMAEEELNRRRARVAAEAADRRARRVAGARRRGTGGRQGYGSGPDTRGTRRRAGSRDRGAGDTGEAH